MDEGYIKLFRSMTSWEWYQDANTTRVFLHLLLNANWEDSRYRGYEIPRGSVVTGLHALSESLGISIKSVRTALKHLKSTGEVTIQTTNRFSVVTIANWEKFQGNIEEGSSQTAGQVAHKGQLRGSQGATYKEYKEIKNIRREEDISSDVSVPDMEQVQEIFNKVCIFFKPCLAITKNRSDKLKKLLKQFSIDEIKEVFEKANSSDFLQGKNDQGWVATFDWLIIIDNFVKVKEGNFDKVSNVYKGSHNTYKKHYYDFEALERETREPKRQIYDFEAIDKEIRAK